MCAAAVRKINELINPSRGAGVLPGLGGGGGTGGGGGKGQGGTRVSVGVGAKERVFEGTWVSVSCHLMVLVGSLVWPGGLWLPM